MDAQLRQSDPTQALAARLRAGELSKHKVRIAGFLGHGPSQEITDVQTDIFHAANRMGQRERCLVAADALDQQMPIWVVHNISAQQWAILCKDLFYEDHAHLRWVFRCDDGLKEFKITEPLSGFIDRDEGQIIHDIRLELLKKQLYPCLPAVKRMCMAILSNEFIYPERAEMLMHPAAISIQESLTARVWLKPEYFLRIVDVGSDINFDRSIGALLA